MTPETDFSSVLISTLTKQLIPVNNNKILNMLILICNKEIKNVLGYFIETPFGYTYTEIFSFMKGLFREILRYIFRKKNEERLMINNVEKPIEKDYSLMTKISLDNITMNELFRYIIKNASYDVDYNNRTMSCLSLSQVEITEIYRNIIISYEGCKIKLNNLEFKYIKENNEVMLQSVSGLNNNISFIDLLTDEYSVPIRKYFDKFDQNILNDLQLHPITNEKLTYYVNNNSEFRKSQIYLIFLEIVDLFNLSKKNLGRSFHEFAIVHFLLASANGKYLYSISGTEYVIVMNNKKFYINKEKSAKISNSAYLSKPLYTNVYDICNYSIIREMFSEKYLQIDTKTTETLSFRIEFSEKEISETEYSERELSIVLEQFIKSLAIVSSKSKVKIYSIGYEETITRTDTTNPLYTEFQQKLNLLKEQEKKEFLSNEEVPASTILIEKKNKSIKQVFCNETSRNIETLYLNKKSKIKLTKSLNMFRNNKKRMIELGLPNKLGIMLHGMPGTGKSTVVLSCATYLSKDIYYVQLNTISSNQELLDIFNYVMKNCVNGGIIVFEDIDCASPIVLKRDYRTEDISSENSAEETASDSAIESVYSTDNNNKLTLDFLLNLLQGSLQQDNTCFIMTTNHLDKLDPALIRAGRIDCLIEMSYCDRDMFNDIYKNFIGRNIPNKSFKKNITPAEFIFHVKDYDETNDDDEILDKFIC